MSLLGTHETARIDRHLSLCRRFPSLSRWCHGLGLMAAAVLAIGGGIARGHEGVHSSDHQHATEGAATNAVSTSRANAKVLPSPPSGDDVFHFVIYGDRTGGVPAGLKVLEQAVVDTNLLDPDLVMTVGDLVQGYNETDQWLEQMQEFKDIVNRLNMKWYPVAGNHDVYWRGQSPAPPGQHESNYEKHFGPLWYSFAHKNSGFIVLYSDEGDPATNLKAFNVAALQNMSEGQIKFLESALKEMQDKDHVFVFLHHPRWIGGGYEGSNWPRVHEKLVAAKNVTAVFAGHIHHMRYDGEQDGIAYYALATTGGALQAEIPDAGYLHHLNVVTVREKRISVSAIPVGAVIDPKQFTPEFLAEVDAARKVRCVQTSPALVLDVDGACQGSVTMKIKNPGTRDVDITLMHETETSRSGWQSTLDHSHFVVAAGADKEIAFEIVRNAGSMGAVVVPAVRMEIDVLASSARVRLPAVDAPLRVTPGQVPAEYFSGVSDHCLLMTDDSSAIRVDSKDLELPDGPMTVEAWVRPSSVLGYRGVLAKTESSEFAIFSDEGVPEFSIYVGGRYVTAKAVKPMVVNQWAHLAGVYNGSEVKLFVDGELVGAKQVGSESVNGKAIIAKRKRNQLPLFIGADTDARGAPTRGIRGMIDEVRVSKAAVYSAPFTPVPRHTPTSETVLLMHLDRSIGPFVLDHSDAAAQGLLGAESVLVESPPKN
ncbi:LamG-like jellyroll fold domain-containing protein [Aporhodopirellula aestuarii]|uniref:Metallophosphoesterase n=1 Tax=Aporhodopirellula aestuarii TaxID=2950107 RepID=A0ABT0U6S7_9BACT|nr:LamG-like jellyroll fold domain-containing protein [Aporhodopirellula aestuarii]MCM2372041.1 metallophosphoesterase [Aporhodopirellula aestuarii]